MSGWLAVPWRSPVRTGPKLTHSQDASRGSAVVGNPYALSRFRAHPLAPDAKLRSGK